jgi:predicted unusual protein kinase regulating ubiquinone biosynthesis (AarF/ABC1/UbiB family)
MFLLKIYFLFIKYSLIYLFFYSNDFYDNLLYDLANTNIIFIKIFQWLSAEKKFNNNFLCLLNKYCDNCPYNEDCIDKKTLLELIDYSKNNNIDLNIDSLIPYRSGSINLVFKGKLNKKEIIIKILRKDIIKKINESIIFFNNINKIFYIILYIFNLHNIIEDIIHKNKNILIDQANLKKEIENIKLFKNKYKKSNYLIIPNVYEDFSNKFDNLIVMDYIDGKTVDNIKLI